MSDLVSRLRDTPNWQREVWRNWKECTSVYDRAPFESADEIERLRSRLAEYEACTDAGRERRLRVVAEAKLAEAEALLREARPFLEDDGVGPEGGGYVEYETSPEFFALVGRIDAFLAGVSRPASTAPADST